MPVPGEFGWFVRRSTLGRERVAAVGFGRPYRIIAKLLGLLSHLNVLGGRIQPQYPRDSPSFISVMLCSCLTMMPATDQ